MNHFAATHAQYGGFGAAMFPPPVSLIFQFFRLRKRILILSEFVPYR